MWPVCSSGLELPTPFNRSSTLPEADIVSEMVSRGEIELGIVVITQILTTPGVALAGPLPSEIQSYITFTGGISTKSESIDAAKELMTVLKSPAAFDVMRSQGMEPGKWTSARDSSDSRALA